jgi:serine O-acetyltransferase
MFKKLRKDIDVVFERDPAARSIVEILLCYPGLHAIWMHRLAHWLWDRKFRLLGRFISHISRLLTGIEIHPGAEIGEGFFIDHGMGVVIGETAEVGKNVTLYHGVTLGGTSWKKEKRHPTVGDNVIIGANATILGPITIGSNSKIGSGSVVVKDIPTNSTVVGVPGRVVFREGDVYKDEKGIAGIPDPEAKAMKCLVEQIHALEKKVEQLSKRIEEHEVTKAHVRAN